MLSVGGRAPLLAWFSRVRESCYHHGKGRVRCTRAESEGAYAELTLLLVLANGRFFVPCVKASSPLSRRLARAYYGMPKALAPATFGEHGRRLLARVERSSLEGDRRGGRVLLTGMARAVLPRWGWQAHFPSGGSVRTRLPRVERAECVRMLQARIVPHLPQLPDPVEPFGLGLLLEGARMRLLPPDHLEARPA